MKSVPKLLYGNHRRILDTTRASAEPNSCFVPEVIQPTENQPHHQIYRRRDVEQERWRSQYFAKQLPLVDSTSSVRPPIRNSGFFRDHRKNRRDGLAFVENFCRYVDPEVAASSAEITETLLSHLSESLYLKGYE